MLHSILDGLRYVKNDVPLASLMLVVAVLNFAITGPTSVGIAMIAKQRFGTPLAFGFLMSALAAGGLTGTLLAGFSKHHKRGRRLLFVSTVIGLCLASIGVLNLVSLLTGVLFLMSGAAAFLNIQLIAWFQQRVERTMMGRVMSVLMFASIGLMPFSLAVAGVAVKWSLPGTFFAAGVMVLLVTLLAAAHRTVREID
jgi:MFS family permease